MGFAPPLRGFLTRARTGAGRARVRAAGPFADCAGAGAGFGAAAAGALSPPFLRAATASATWSADGAAGAVAAHSTPAQVRVCGGRREPTGPIYEVFQIL